MKKIMRFSLLVVVVLTGCVKESNIRPSNNYQFIGVVHNGKFIQLPLDLPNCNMKLTEVKATISRPSTTKITLDSLSFTMQSPDAFWFGTGSEQFTLHNFEEPLQISENKITHRGRLVGKTNGDTLTLKILRTNYFRIAGSNGGYMDYRINKDGSYTGTGGINGGDNAILTTANGFARTSPQCRKDMWYYGEPTATLRMGGTDFSQSDWVFVKR
ncbi:hypothetical protein [Runella zeae]|uniref:hypothetical protein n=1 Tax=Runella zeae TaxID=94255 RepID=UPI00041DD515|nr:hypothetical protein [Runella zeae]